MVLATSITDIHPEFLTALIVSASNEADGVYHLLSLWDIKTRSESGALVPKQFSREFLLAAGVAIRFKVWEMNKTYFHLDAGLPSCSELLVKALQLQSGSELAQLAEMLNMASLRLFHDHFVWLAKNELQVDLGFQDPLNDDQLDAIADFIWNNRHILVKGKQDD
ncbi:MAG: hypothetical protein JWN70_2980 [Planctomycetaceae bacterium]|nr:hypothetical protein [Planctomycetaceae bacterium]